MWMQKRISFLIGIDERALTDQVGLSQHEQPHQYTYNQMAARQGTIRSGVV
jgi:hypothetical protein